VGALIAVIGGLYFVTGFAYEDESWASGVSVLLLSAVFFICFFVLLLRDRGMAKRSLIGSPDSSSVFLSSANHLTVQVDGHTAFEHVIGGEGGYSIAKTKQWYFLTIRRLYYMPIPRNEESKAVLLASGIDGRKL
jgi:hypothetical protein